MESHTLERRGTLLFYRSLEWAEDWSVRMHELGWTTSTTISFLMISPNLVRWDSGWAKHWHGGRMLFAGSRSWSLAPLHPASHLIDHRHHQTHLCFISRTQAWLDLPWPQCILKEEYVQNNSWCFSLKKTLTKQGPSKVQICFPSPLPFPPPPPQ